MKLPDVYVNPINKEFNNNKEIYYGDNYDRNKLSKYEINKRINDIFKDKSNLYKCNVLITIDGKKEERIIVGRKNNYLIDIKGNLINTDNITDIVKK